MTDAFDSLMNKTAAVMQKDPAASADDCGQPGQGLVVVGGLNAVPCRLSSMPGSGRESKVDKEANIDRYKVYMRVVAVTEHNFLQIAGIVYNIINVVNPSLADHHLECLVERVKP